MSLAVGFKNQGDRFKDNATPVIVDSSKLEQNRKALIKDCTGVQEEEYLVSTFYDLVSSIRDPEYNNTLEELDIVSPQSILLTSRRNLMRELKGGKYLITLEWQPTVAHCSYAFQIGLAIRYMKCDCRKKLIDELPNYAMYKIDIYVKAGSHLQASESSPSVI